MSIKNYGWWTLCFLPDICLFPRREGWSEESDDYREQHESRECFEGNSCCSARAYLLCQGARCRSFREVPFRGLSGKFSNLGSPHSVFLFLLPVVYGVIVNQLFVLICDLAAFLMLCKSLLTKFPLTRTQNYS